jgi:hypothetical protein
LTPQFADYSPSLVFLVVCLFSGRPLPEMKADSLHHFGDFALLVCQNAMQAMNVGFLSSDSVLDYANPTELGKVRNEQKTHKSKGFLANQA